LVGPDGTDAASPKKLKGEYAFTTTLSCLVAPGSAPGPGNPTPGTALPNSGFNANLQPLVSETAYTTTFATEGVRVFNGDGTGTFTGTSFGLNHRPTPGPTGYPSFAPGAGTSSLSALFKYTVNSDDTFEVEFEGPVTGTILTGPITGQTFSFGPVPLTGLIGKNGDMLTLASIVPTVETISFSGGAVFPRICHRSSVLVKMDKN
jgi:hypothetical protein